jgi:hypothetical protein
MPRGPAGGDIVSTAHRSDRVEARGGKYVIGYLVAASMMLVLWLGLYAWALKGSSGGAFAAHDCPEIADQARRLACYDSISHPSQRQPSRGYGPVVR